MDSKTITLPDDKKKLVGLLITKEELFKDLFIKKKLLQEKKLTLHSKGYELGFLKGIVDGRKALKKNLIRDDTNTLTNVTYLEGSMITKQAKVSEDSHDIKIVTSVPRLFRIPFYLVSIPQNQKIELEMDMKSKKLKIMGEDELTYYPYYKVLGKKGANNDKLGN